MFLSSFVCFLLLFSVSFSFSSSFFYFSFLFFSFFFFLLLSLTGLKLIWATCPFPCFLGGLIGYRVPGFLPCPETLLLYSFPILSTASKTLTQQLSASGQRTRMVSSSWDRTYGPSDWFCRSSGLVEVMLARGLVVTARWSSGSR